MTPVSGFLPLFGAVGAAHDGGMRYLLVIAGLVIVGLIAVSVLKALLGFLGYILVGAIVVGAGVYLYNRARRSLGGRGRYRLPR
jgi:hypothetical protein